MVYLVVMFQAWIEVGHDILCEKVCMALDYNACLKPEFFCGSNLVASQAYGFGSCGLLTSV